MSSFREDGWYVKRTGLKCVVTISLIIGVFSCLLFPENVLALNDTSKFSVTFQDAPQDTIVSPPQISTEDSNINTSIVVVSKKETTEAHYASSLHSSTRTRSSFYAKRLPVTGEEYHPVLIGLGVLFVFFGLFFFLVNQRREEKYHANS